MKDFLMYVLIGVAMALAGYRLVQNASRFGDHPDAGAILCTLDGKAYRSSENFFTMFQAFRFSEADSKCAKRGDK